MGKKNNLLLTKCSWKKYIYMFSGNTEVIRTHAPQHDFWKSHFVPSLVKASLQRRASHIIVCKSRLWATSFPERKRQTCVLHRYEPGNSSVCVPSFISNLSGLTDAAETVPLTTSLKFPLPLASSTHSILQHHYKVGWLWGGCCHLPNHAILTVHSSQAWYMSPTASSPVRAQKRPSPALGRS